MGMSVQIEEGVCFAPSGRPWKMGCRVYGEPKPIVSAAMLPVATVNGGIEERMMADTELIIAAVNSYEDMIRCVTALVRWADEHHRGEDLSAAVCLARAALSSVPSTVKFGQSRRGTRS